MIQFADFVPEMLKPPGIFQPGEYESFEEALAAANEWIVGHQIDVVNVETVVLPNIWSHYEEGSTDVSLGTGESVSRWHQFIRVWYRGPANRFPSTDSR